MIPVKEYTAKVDEKKRITLRNVIYEYFNVAEHENGKIILEPRILINPEYVSKNTLDMMDRSVKNLKEIKFPSLLIYRSLSNNVAT